MIIHFILSGETLESLSEEIHLENPKYLKEYHNQRCSANDYIHENLVSGKRLFMPNMDEVRKYNLLNDAPFKSPELNPIINFEPKDFSRIYFVRITEGKEKDGETKDNTLTYTASLKWVETHESEHVFYLYKNNFTDGQSSKLADLAVESIRSLNPLIITTNTKGEMIKVSLKPETINNFNKIKERLLDLFPDQYAELYIKEYEMAVLNQELFNERMKDDPFIKNYFASLRNSFINGKSFFEQKIEDHTVPIQQKVEDINYTSEMVLLQNSFPNSEIIFSGKYSLYTQTGIVKKADVQYDISLYGVKYYTFFSFDELS
ncbi:hypothetical protein VUJ46_09215 [Chryseobacterium sp. MYb264]|uniref:hypothetical protein n=1 Tax=Chryseobacterium sp. MYb264 TaxID=2745153 RepID=UPI002E0F45D6|nr:hypothetical protein VUJ46_09215 [Chryseobacterium sp. MYb264]